MTQDPEQEQGIFEPPGPPTHCSVCGTRFHKGRCPFRNKPDHSGERNEKALLDEDGDPYEPYTAEELAIMWETHYPQAEDGDSWFTGRWLATVRELQGALEFYADEQNWRLMLMTHPPKYAILEDGGKVARKALGKEEEPKEGTK